MPDVTLAPVPVMVQRYECPFCKRRRSVRKATAVHIARCWLNPAAKACKTCEHFTDVPSGDYCEGGRPCACNKGFQQCEAGIPDVAAGEIRTGCPLWKLKETSDG